MRQIFTKPYRLFFPLGLTLGIWGILIWLIHILFKTSYPGIIHSQIMVGGFLTSYISGFLMTAVPRFTGTTSPDYYEIGISLVVLIVLPFINHDQPRMISILLLIGNLNLLFFFLRRYRKRKNPLPVYFLFIPMSLLSAAIGHSLILLSQLGFAYEWFYNLGRLLSLQAFISGIVLGIGSRIIPAFNGFSPRSQKSNLLSIIIILFFMSSYFIQIFISLRVGLMMRAIVLTYMAVTQWSIFRTPMNPSKLSYGIWLSCWGIVLGAMGGFIFPAQLLNWNHLIFISGFGLMTLMIGSRVVLAHEGFDLAKEGESKGIIWIIVCLLSAGLIRSLIGYANTQFYSIFLFLSASLWIFGCCYWWILIGIKKIKN